MTYRVLGKVLIVALFLLATDTVLAQAPGAKPTSALEGDPAAGRVKATTCKGCHGIPGYVTVYPTYPVPRVGGQHAKYIVSALKAYRAGKRDHATMHAQARSLSNQDIVDIAAWFSSLAPVKKPPQNPNAPGAKLAQNTCASCHGKTGISTVPTFPILAGQYRGYLIQALKDYKTGARKNAIMNGIAASLSLEEIRLLATYYSSQNYLRTLEIAEEIKELKR